MRAVWQGGGGGRGWWGVMGGPFVWTRGRAQEQVPGWVSHQET